MKLYYTEQEVREKKIKLEQPYFTEMIYPFFPITISDQMNNTSSVITAEYKRVTLCKGPTKTYIYVLDGFEDYVLNLHKIKIT